MAGTMIAKVASNAAMAKVARKAMVKRPVRRWHRELRELETGVGIGLMRFRQSHRGEDQVGEGQRGGEKNRRAQTRVAEQAADRGTEDEAEAKGGADHAHAVRAVRFVGGVGDVSLRGRDGGGAGAVDRARKQQPCEGGREAVNDVASGRSEQAQHDYRTAADVIGNPSEHRRAEELHQRIDRKHQADAERADMHPFGIQRQERDHDAEAEQVDEDRQEEHDQRGPALFRGRRGGQGFNIRH
jgi:hypothetical protein